MVYLTSEYYNKKSDSEKYVWEGKDMGQGRATSPSLQTYFS